MVRSAILVFLFLYGFLLKLPLLSASDGPIQESPSNIELVKSMPLRDLCGQLIVVSGYSSKGDSHFSLLKKWTRKGEIGGVIWMQGSPHRQKRMIEELQRISLKKNGIPQFMAQDAEWGASMRLDSLERLPWPLTLGATKNLDLAYEYGKSLGQESKYLGININFSPVVDLNTNPKNPIIGQRSLGSDISNVNLLSGQQILGIQSQKVIACAKHFPGHGDTEKDSHKTLPILSHDKETFKRREMSPFIHSIKKGVGAIMVAHLDIPSLDPSGIPASLSKIIVSDWLRDSLNFQGLVFTDALNMRGLAQDLPPGEIEVRAIEAGNDLLLFVSDPKAVIDAIIEAIKIGRLSRDLIETHVLRILNSKLNFIFSEYDENYDSKMIHDHRKNLSKKIYAKSKTLVFDKSKVFDSNHISNFFFKTYVDGVNNDKYLNNILSRYEEDLTKAQPGKKDFIWFVNVQPTDNPWKRGFISKQLISDANKFKENGFDIGLIQMANPYGLIRGSDLSSSKLDIDELFNSVIIGYEGRDMALELMIDAILIGEKEQFQGRIPASGINLNPILNRSSFNMMKIDNSILDSINLIVSEGLSENAFPGCQIFLSRHGNVMVDSAWGTLNGLDPLNKNHLFDIASLTKILASMPLLMKHYEDNENGGSDFLDACFSQLLPEFKGTVLDSIKIKDVLAHQSGLPGWIPFYQDFIMPEGTLSKDYFSSEETEDFNIWITPNLFASRKIRDTIFKSITSVQLGELHYRYSDLGFYLFQRFLEKENKQNIDQILKTDWYNPMELEMTFSPLENGYLISDIAPTEYDSIFRGVQIQGTVHDQGAALLGGVAGHAGLFANASSVGKMMQLFLNGGSYNGYEYLNSETIDQFVKCFSCESGNRRGLGFDRPQMEGDGPTCGCVSPKSFGHTGFTGTFAWADPESGIVLVFLSNRIFPDAENKKIYELNIRTRIQQAVQNCIL
tara:strand:- start:159 stop:3035 length:2877 start_codon:yes stop_codon:yes gene_type:complete